MSGAVAVAFPAPVAARLAALRQLGAEVTTWEAWGLPFALVTKCPEDAREQLEREPGWGRYSEAGSVWGWERRGWTKGEGGAWAREAGAL